MKKIYSVISHNIQTAPWRRRCDPLHGYKAIKCFQRLYISFILWQNVKNKIFLLILKVRINDGFFLKLSFYLQAITDKSGVDDNNEDKLSCTSYKVWEISSFWKQEMTVL